MSDWPKLAMKIQPPIEVMEATPVDALARDPGWQFEPKWDGFRCVAFRSGNEVALQSKAGKPLTRYFPEVVAHLLAIKAKHFVLDGELTIPAAGGLDFDAPFSESNTRDVERPPPAVAKETFAERLRKPSRREPQAYGAQRNLRGTQRCRDRRDTVPH